MRYEDRSKIEYLLERVESIMIEGIKLPENVFPSKIC